MGDPLYEHEAKALLRRCGVAVPRGAFAPIPALAAEAASAIGFPVVVKAQVHARSRYGAGGIAEARSAREVREAGAVIMNVPILGEMPSGLLVEEVVPVAEEHRLVVSLDPVHLSVAFAAGGAPVTRTQRRDGRGLDAWIGTLDLGEARRAALARTIEGVVACATAHRLAAVELDPLAWTGAAYVALDAQAYRESAGA